MTRFNIFACIAVLNIYIYRDIEALDKGYCLGIDDYPASTECRLSDFSLPILRFHLHASMLFGCKVSEEVRNNYLYWQILIWYAVYCSYKKTWISIQNNFMQYTFCRQWRTCARNRQSNLKASLCIVSRKI